MAQYRVGANNLTTGMGDGLKVTLCCHQGSQRVRNVSLGAHVVSVQIVAVAYWHTP